MNKKNVGTGIACQRKEKGITLIALIITIIVILILVAVSVRTVVNSGIFNHSKDATSKWADAQNKEANISIDDLITEYVDFSNIQYKIGEKDADGNYIVDIKLPEYARGYGILDPNDTWNILSANFRIPSGSNEKSGSNETKGFAMLITPDFGPLVMPQLAGLPTLVKYEFANQRTEKEKDMIAIYGINIMRAIAKDGYKIQRATNLSDAYKLFNNIWNNEIINGENMKPELIDILKELQEKGFGKPEQARDIAYWTAAAFNIITNVNVHDIILSEDSDEMVKQQCLESFNESNSQKWDSTTQTYVPVEGYVPYSTFEECLVAEYNKRFETSYSSIDEIEEGEGLPDWKSIIEKMEGIPFELIAILVDFEVNHGGINNILNFDDFFARLQETSQRAKSIYTSSNSPTTVYEIELEGFEKRSFTLEEMLTAFENMKSEVEETSNEGFSWFFENLLYIQENSTIQKSELKLKITTNGIAKEYTIKTQM